MGYPVVPEVSVVMPLFNKAAVVEQSILSVLMQDPPAKELLVVDDGATDDSASRVAALCKSNPRIRLIRQANQGVAAARNTGVQLAAGSHVAFLDADDCWRPGYLSAVMKMIHDFPHAGMYATGYIRSTSPPRDDTMGLNDSNKHATVVEHFFRLWTKHSFAFTCSITLPTRVLNALTPAFPEKEQLGEDQDLWFRVAERWPVVFLDVPLVWYRIGQTESLTGGKVPAHLLPCYLRLAERCRAQGFPERHRWDAKRLVASHWINVARQRLAEGNRQGAWELMRDRNAWANWTYWWRTALFALRP